MKIRWLRGKGKIDFNRPNVFFVNGIRGSAKSSWLERVAEYYLEKGHTVFDLFSSKDGESLAWLRSPYAETKKILLIHGENCSVTAPCDCKAASKVTLSDFERYDILISTSPLYSSIDDEFVNAAHLTDLIYKRLSWKKLVYTLCREAANLFYSRLKVSETQIVSKASMAYLIREARHAGLALGLDSTRFYSIDIDIRNLTDFMVLKSQGLIGLSSELDWLYSLFQPSIIRNMPLQFFIILSRTGAIGIGRFKPVSWHKQERENILKAVGVRVERGEAIEQGEYRGTHTTVGDPEHADIIKLYVHEGLSMNRIAEKLGRSSRTPCVVIKKHDAAIGGAGFCPSCRRVKSNLDKSLAKRK